MKRYQHDSLEIQGAAPVLVFISGCSCSALPGLGSAAFQRILFSTNHQKGILQGRGYSHHSAIHSSFPPARQSWVSSKAFNNSREHFPQKEGAAQVQGEFNKAGTGLSLWAPPQSSFFLVLPVKQIAAKSCVSSWLLINWVENRKWDLKSLTSMDDVQAASLGWFGRRGDDAHPSPEPVPATLLGKGECSSPEPWWNSSLDTAAAPAGLGGFCGSTETQICPSLVIN